MTSTTVQQAGSTAVAGDAAAADGATLIDYRRVTRLAMYPREQLFVIRFDDDTTRSVEREVYDEALRRLQAAPDRRLEPALGGVYDVIWNIVCRL